VSAPPDADAVISCVRLGWLVSELRGRNRPDAPADPDRQELERPEHDLPLVTERSDGELRVQAGVIVQALADRLKVDPALPNQPAPPPPPRTRCDDVRDTAKDLGRARRKAERDPFFELQVSQRWKDLAERIYYLDAGLQDNISGVSETQFGGYQLGRGLADIYWALDTTAAPDSLSSWEVLFGEERRKPLNRYLGRLASYFDNLTSPAISGALQAWAQVATDADWRRDSGGQLREQIRRFYALLVTGQDPQSYVQPLALVRHWRTTWKVAKAFRFELLLLVVALGAAAGLGWLLSHGGGSAAGKVVLGLITAVGLPIATIKAQLKNSTQALLKRLKSAAYADLVCEGVTTIPDKPEGTRLQSPKRAAEREVRATVRTRALNPTVASPLT
jgi:hypothetical protein